MPSERLLRHRRRWTTARILPRLLALILAGGALAVGAEPADRTPVLLRGPLLLPPVESTGTGLAPEVKVRVTIDPRGRVSEVEVLSIQPSTEYDEAFRKKTVRSLENWRYAPAISDGQPTSSTLEWTVKFKARSSSSSVSLIPLLPPILAQERDRQARRDQVLGLTVEQRQEILSRYSTVAEKHVNPRHRQQAQTPRFLVVTDAQSPGAAEVIAHNLEASLLAVQNLLSPDIAPHPAPHKILVYLYARRSDFEAMRAELRQYTHSDATYYPPGLIVYYLEVPSDEFLLSLLIHEASHAYSDHHLRRFGVPFPRWLEEGFAEYMGNSEVKKGRLVPGRTLKRRFVLNHGRTSPTRRNTVAGDDLALVKKAMIRGQGLSLSELVSADRAAFTGDQFPLYYGTAWLFVHFLRHGEDGWASENFSRMMFYIAEGYPAREALEASYGRPLADFEKPFLKYVRGF